MGQKQKNRKLNKIKIQKEIEAEVKSRKIARYGKLKKIIFKILIGIAIGALLVGGFWLIYGKKMKNNSFNKTETKEYGVIETEKGKIVFEFYSDAAPKTVENFDRLAQSSFYDGLTFHRVVPEFVIQGGDPKGDGTGGDSSWGGKFADEINPKSLGLSSDTIKQNEDQGYKYDYKLESHKMVNGSVAMANSGPNTNGSQFFIVIGQEQTHLDGKHTVFGQVVEGMDVALQIKQGDKMTKVYTIQKEEYDLSKTK
ncbi:MAG: peptidylprolyl isomerase [Patescibacteria group bacterium]|jgi:peptidyl-prolyl cis-trans isomerase B (cyclophilin B)